MELPDARRAHGRRATRSRSASARRAARGPSVLIAARLYSHMGWYRPLGEAPGGARRAPSSSLDRRGAGISEGVAGPHGLLAARGRRPPARRRQDQGAPSRRRACARLGISLGAAMTLATSLVHADCFQRQAAALAGARARPAAAAAAAHRPRLQRRSRVRACSTSCPSRWSSSAIGEELRQALWSDPLRTRAFTSRFLLEVFRMQRFVRRNIDRLRAPLLALLAEKDAMVDNEVVAARSCSRVERHAGARRDLRGRAPRAAGVRAARGARRAHLTTGSRRPRTRSSRAS